jgi:hypothetical protein
VLDESVPEPNPTPAPTTLHVADLDGSAVLVGTKGNWQATVTATVRDTGGNPVQGATLNGTWGSCTTDGLGQCSLDSAEMRKNKSSVTLTVEDVTHPTLAYDAAANADPDGDSDGTAITVNKP